MDAQTCLKKLKLVGVLAFATVDQSGAPQVRNISAIHYEPDRMIFFTARGKSFCDDLLRDGRVQILGYTKYKEMIRLSARAVPIAQSEQARWIDAIFAEQPYLSNVYPGQTRHLAGIVFEIRSGEIEYFHLGVHPILRERFALGASPLPAKGYEISQKCVGCGQCLAVCPQKCIQAGAPYRIEQSHCLRCGNCFRQCPQHAIEKRG